MSQWQRMLMPQASPRVAFPESQSLLTETRKNGWPICRYRFSWRLFSKLIAKQTVRNYLTPWNAGESANHALWLLCRKLLSVSAWVKKEFAFSNWRVEQLIEPWCRSIRPSVSKKRKNWNI